MTEQIEVELHREGKERFGTDCKHENVTQGRCTKCLRRVVSKFEYGLAVSATRGIDGRDNDENKSQNTGLDE